MKKCKSCQKEIDSKATKCPHCQSDQRNWFMKHKITTVILVIIVLAMASGNSGTKTQNQQTGANQKAAESKSPKVAGIKEPVQDDNLVFTVNSISKAKQIGNTFTQKNAQGTFYVVNITIENKGNKTATFDSSMAKVKDGQGREFDRSIDGQTAKSMSEGKTDLFLQQIQPTLSVTGDLVFDLPATISSPSILLKGSMFSAGAQVKLE